MSSMLPVYARQPVAFERGEGVYLFSTTGERYLDFGSGVAVNALGHTHPRLVAALETQARKLWHVSNVYENPEAERFADRLTARSFADQVFFTNSGAEALECAIKMARRYHFHQGSPERYRLITFEGAFHGRTLATIAAGGQEKYREGFGPVVPGFDHVPMNDLEAVSRAITPETAGILLEPIQGEGGVRMFAPETLRALKDLCVRHGLLLIFDEVQCGMGRMGTLFAHERLGVFPDIMALAKGIGGGFPLGACLATRAASVGMGAGSHGSTYGGNPLAMAVGQAVLDVMEEPGFLENVAHSSLLLKQKLAAMRDLYPHLISEVRGDGLLLGLRCVPENTKIIRAALEQKLLLIGAGDNVVRLVPPLVIAPDEIEEGIDRLDKALAKLRQDGV